MILMNTQDGLKALLSQAKPERISVVVITSRATPDHYKTTLAYFESLGFVVPEEKILFYTAPNYKSHKNALIEAGLSLEKPRTESVPEIKDPDNLCLIIDESYETGRTLDCAVEALKKQGVDENRIWFRTMSVDTNLFPQYAGFLNPIRDYDKFRTIPKI